MTSVPAPSPSSDTPAGHARRGGTISIRIGLLALVVVCTLPATLVAGLAVYETYALRKTRIYETTVLTARRPGRRPGPGT